ncbi:hypothetical protein GS429_13045 [Natronorubrum sp. JWXQ-INN-674]|uniref:Uncharacterized protein n=1 Tax=Natronorubrum halalkaliphilum TaxID=2691917 RepID=A0A6B0VPC3_9EURY|nr:hypothetical protein [Natronorubrum halalkaliphilum]MXV62977.1 hypothetical protein [Natronorubrum halalkaliphilum]
MALKGILSGDPSKSSKLYLAIGGISLVKAIAVRNDQERFRRELIDAGLFLGVGLALRKYSQLKAEKRSEIESQIPDWAIGMATSEPAKQGVRNLAKQRLGGRSEPEPEESLRDRAMNTFSSR